MRPWMPAAVLLCLAASGCGPLVVPIDSTTPAPFTGDEAARALTDQLPGSILAQIGYTLPATWPPDAPRVSVDVQFGLFDHFDAADVEGAGIPVAALTKGDAVLRVAAVDAVLDRGTFNHRIVAVQYLVGPHDAVGPNDQGVVPVGYFTGLAAGGGPLVFAPGGRRALARFLAAGRGTFLLRFVMPFDSAANPARPAGHGTLELDLHLVALE